MCFPRVSILDRILSRIDADMDTELNTMLVDYAVTEFEGEYRWKLEGSFIIGTRARTWRLKITGMHW